MHVMSHFAPTCPIQHVGQPWTWTPVRRHLIAVHKEENLQAETTDYVNDLRNPAQMIKDHVTANRELLKQ